MGNRGDKSRKRLLAAVLGLLALLPFVAALSARPRPAPKRPAIAADLQVAVPPCHDPAAPTRRYFLDARHGSDSADGRTPATAWRSLAAVVRGGRPMPFLVPGTEIVLADGEYGPLALIGAGGPGPVTASGTAPYISFVAAPGSHPVLASLGVRGASRLMVRGLRFEPPAGGSQTAGLVRMAGQPGAELHDIRLLDNELSSRGAVSGWSQTDWQTRAPRTAIAVTGGPAARCVVIAGNSIHGVGNGILLTGDDGRIVGNRIRDFALDAIDFAGNRIEISGNSAFDNHSLGTGSHNDMIQGLRGPEDDAPPVADPSGRMVRQASTWSDVRIVGNLLVRQGRPDIGVPGTVQGISGFAGNWVRLVVANNVVVIGGPREVPPGDFYDDTGRSELPFSLFRPCSPGNPWGHQPAGPGVTAENARSLPPERLGWRTACSMNAVTFGSVRHGAIFNNTLVTDNPAVDSVGVLVQSRNAGGAETCDTIVANNLVTGMNLRSLAATLVERAPAGAAERADACSPGRIRNFAAGNLALAPLAARGLDLRQVFLNYAGLHDGGNFAWDLHLRPGSPAIGAGSAASARAVRGLTAGVDIEGRPHKAGPHKAGDVGAYAF
jgi:hypothetical protein